METGQKIDPLTLALITAAAVAAMGGRAVRVERIRLIQRRNTAWTEAGRLMIHTSHLIGKNN